MTSIRKQELIFEYAHRKSHLRKKIDKFILENEHLGTLPAIPQYHFCSLDKSTEEIVSAVILSLPIWNTNPILGDEYRYKQLLIARGHSTKHNSASFTLSRVVKWIVQNTDHRCLYGYADETAGEFGRVYLATNFVYLGNRFGNNNTPPLKRKYAIVRGKSKKETQKLSVMLQSRPRANG